MLDNGAQLFFKLVTLVPGDKDFRMMVVVQTHLDFQDCLVAIAIMLETMVDRVILGVGGSLLTMDGKAI